MWKIIIKKKILTFLEKFQNWINVPKKKKETLFKIYNLSTELKEEEKKKVNLMFFLCST